MHAPHIHGVIAKKKNNIPVNILNWGLIKSFGALIIPTLKIIKGMLNIITITLPIAKFLLLSKFIDPDIDEIEVNIGELIKKVINTKYEFVNETLSIIHAIGMITMNGNWKKNQIAINLIKTINS